jgi:ferrous iron transport protein B
MTETCHDDVAANRGSDRARAADRPQIVLAGNPNVGKTTLFNALTGLSAKVSNYPGITVERRSGVIALPTREADLHDLPGTYSLNARSAEEQIALDALAGLQGERAPDAVIVCVDATQLARSAYLLLQIRELGARCVVALTMVDEAGAAAPDASAFAALLDCAVVPVIARVKKGLPELIDAVDRVLRSDRASKWQWQPSASLRAHVDAVKAALPDTWRASKRYGKADERADDALALWALTCLESEGTDSDELVGVPHELRAVVASRLRGTNEGATRELGELGRDVDDEAVLSRWRWLDREIPRLTQKKPDRSRSERIDRVLLHRAFGFVAFMAVMTVMFMSLFAWADPVIDFIDTSFKSLGEAVKGAIGDGIFGDFVADGVIAGVGGVLVFLPQILLLFLFLGFLEDCGYLARVAYLMDRIMRSMNLHGRAFVPMLFGFACAVPAITATRTMERRRDRILTMMVVPLMTCSARLPVYTLLIAALIPASRLTQAGLMVGMYLFSVLTSLAAAWVMSKTIKPLKAKRLPFIIELPPYRFPRVRDVLRMMWSKSSMFLREAGTVILACSIAIWALMYFPHQQATTDAQKAQQIEQSYGGRLGKAIEPAIEPLGFDWKIGVGIIGAFAAREVFVSTLGIVHAVGGEADEESESLRTALQNTKNDDGTKAYTPLVALSLMVFFALAMQCMSTLAVVKRETQSWRWPAFLFGYMTVLAWVASFLVYQGGRLLGFS